MPIHILPLKRTLTVARNTIELHFEKPAGFSFVPGQYGGFTLVNPSESDPKGNTRRFSLLSAPEEEDIVIATRLQASTFKKQLANMRQGDTIKFAGPTGGFTLHEDQNTPAVMIAGGIGIAPFYSMVKTQAANPTHRSIQLFYGNQSKEEAPFLAELSALTQKNPAFQLIPVLTAAPESWHGEIGFISHTLIKKYVPDIHSPIYYICGSPAMVAALHESLLEMGIDETRIRIEDFPGY